MKPKEVKNAEKHTYNLPFRALSEGEHIFDFSIKSAFLSEFDSLSDYSGGDLTVEVVFLKQNSKQRLTVAMKGELETICDRCLEELVLDFSADGVYYLREAEEGEEEKEDVVFVSKDDQKVDLSQLFYEMILLNLPYSKAHEEGECDEEMLAKIEELQEKELEKEIDPRWAELEKLKRIDK